MITLVFSYINIIIQKLIDAGADVNAVTKFNETAISIAAQAGAIPLFACLIKAGNAYQINPCLNY